MFFSKMIGSISFSFMMTIVIVIGSMFMLTVGGGGEWLLVIIPAAPFIFIWLVFISAAFALAKGDN